MNFSNEPLTADEKYLLNTAKYSGAFSTIVQTQEDGKVVRLSAQTDKAIAEMENADVRAKILTFQLNTIDKLITQIAKETEKRDAFINEIIAQKNAISAVTVLQV
jgi:hypothetical protein